MHSLIMFVPLTSCAKLKPSTFDTGRKTHSNLSSMFSISLSYAVGFSNCKTIMNTELMKLFFLPFFHSILLTLL